MGAQRSVEELADRINTLLDQTDTRNRIGLEARRIWQSKYDWQVIGLYFSRLFQTLLEDRQPINLETDLR